MAFKTTQTSLAQSKIQCSITVQESRHTAMPYSVALASIFLVVTFLQHASASVGVVDIDDLLQPNLGQQIYSTSPTSLPYAPWSHKPYCETSPYLDTLGQKYCVYTSNTTGPHGLSLIFPPSSARAATKYLNDNPLDSFLTPESAANLFLHKDGQPWKIVDIPGKDKGVVATRQIEKYETFMVDQAAVVVDTRVEKAVSDVVGRKLMKVAVERLLEPGMIREMSGKHEGNQRFGDKGGVYNDEEEEGRLEDDIMKTNAFGSSVADVSSRALYPLISVRPSGPIALVFSILSLLQNRR